MLERIKNLSLKKLTDQVDYKLLEEMISELQNYHEELEQKTHDLGERVKELNCLYSLSKLIEKPGIEIDELLESFVDVLPPSWHYPDFTCGRIIIDGKEFKTKNFKFTAWIQSAPIIVNHEERGRLEVCYLKEMPVIDEGPFMKEERNLIDAITRRLGHYIEQKEGEDALRASEQKFRSYIHNAPFGVFVADKKGTYIDVNPAATEITGYSKDELLGMNLTDLIAEEDKKNLGKSFERLWQKGELQRDLKYVRKNGTTKDWQLNAVTLDGDKLVGFANDITESKKTDRLLKEREGLYRSLFNKSKDAIYLLFNRKFELVNPEFTTIFGYELDELRQTNLDPIHLIAPESLPFIEERIKKLESGDEVSTRYEFTALTKYGEKREVEASVSYIPYKSGTATQGILRDVTERKQAENEIRSLSEFRNLMAELSANFIHVPLDKIQDSINKSLARLGEIVGADRSYIFEYKFDKGVCNNIFEWCQDDIIPQIDSLQQVPLDFAPDWVEKHTNGKIVNIPDVLKVEKSQIRNLLQEQGIKSLLSIPLFNHDECIGFVGFDAVKEKFSFSSGEIEILQIYAKMLVNSFERQKREQDLIWAKEKAEESDLLKSAFLANMSHEIRTPMNGILGFTNLLKEPKLSGEEKEQYVDIILQSGERMLGTIDDIISISKLESGTMEVKWESFEINKHLDYFYKFFKPEATAKGLDLKINKTKSDENSTIKADKEKINAVLSNLIKNAIKYTPTGSVEFNYQLRDNEVEFIIRDTGIGIDKKRQKAVFERFVQEDFSSTKPYEGAGLGLAISKGYVEMMGGTIGVESEKGKGSKFYFTLPVHVNKSNPEKQQESDEEQQDENESILNTLSVLVAEDDETVRSYIKALLAKKCKELVFAVNGKEAVDLFIEHNGFDVVLMDIKMPVMDGFSATIKIKQFDENAFIIAQTAYVLEVDKQKALAAGCDGYLTKPLKKELLIEKITEHFMG